MELSFWGGEGPMLETLHHLDLRPLVGDGGRLSLGLRPLVPQQSKEFG